MSSTAHPSDAFAPAPDQAPADSSAARYAMIGAFTHDAPGGASPGLAARGLSVYDTRQLPWRAVQVAITPNPSYMVSHPERDVIYAVNEVMQHAGQPRGTIQAYTVQPDPPYLSHMAERALAPGATGPTHIAIDPQGRYLVVSAYAGGQFNLFELDARGMPGEVCDVMKLPPAVPSTSELMPPGRDPRRQEASHAHQALCSPDGSIWIGCDLGTDTISLFTVERARFARKAIYQTAAGAGPRHAAFHPTRAWVYVVNELAISLTGLRYSPTELTRMRRAHDDTSPQADTSLMPDGVNRGCGASALLMHPGGGWLYASTKRVDSEDSRADSVSAWSIDQTTGALSLLWRIAHGIQGARAMTLAEDGGTLYVLNQTGGTVLAMAIDQQSGAHGTPRIVAQVPTPTCLTF